MRTVRGAAQLNRDCYCESVDHAQLRRALEGDGAPGGICYDALKHTHPNLFSDVRVYVAQRYLDFMAELIRVVERVVALPQWQERVLADAPAIARHEPAAAGVMFGYDFHLDADGPRLIEINTNAGGALLNTRLLAAQAECSPHALQNASGAASGVLETAACGEVEAGDGRAVEADLVAMFHSEWARARGDGSLKRIAIVDEDPPTQFLAPEFELFRRLFASAGIACVVVDPRELRFDGQALRHGEAIVDLVYNRLTDFALADPQNAALRAAYLGNKVVVTPHPRAHALYADKRNLIALRDDAWLQAIGVADADREVLARGVPATCLVTADNADEFWETRKRWFFKPSAGFGSRAAYRGDKLTRRVFAQIVNGADGDRGGYIAQALVRPSERSVRVDGVDQRLKVDLRNYSYQGRVQLVSARLYQGQTTNFRTPGGGFAAVYAVR